MWQGVLYLYHVESNKKEGVSTGFTTWQKQQKHARVMGYAKPLAEQLTKKFFLSYFLETLGWLDLRGSRN